MTINFKRGLITGGLVTIMFLLSSNLAGYCNNNATLSYINIEGENSSFKITLKTDRDINVSTKVKSANRLIIELDDTKASQLIQTAFSNASNIDDVIVQPIKNNKTRLFISGNNVSNSKIIIDSTKTPVIADKFAEENSSVYVAKNNRSKLSNKIEEQIAENQTVPAEEFIEDNQIATENSENESTTVDPVETTGIVAAPPVEEEAATEEVTPAEEETSVDDNIINTESAVEPDSLNSDLFKPAADLELPAYSATTTIKDTQASAAEATKNNFASSSIKTSSLFSNSGLIRFGIIFVVVTLLIAYLRKEKLLSFKPRAKKQKMSSEHLDIYRSLHKTTANTTGRSNKQLTSLDSITSGRKRPVTRARKPVNKKALNQFSALQGYNKQNTVNKKASMPANNQALTRNLQQLTGSLTNKSRKKPSNNIEFLKSMAELYERSGRHDLAMNIQKNIRKNLAKT